MQSYSSSTYRIFVGIALPDDLQGHLQDWVAEARTALPFQKWTHPQDVHVTLQFLGDSSPEAALALSADLRQLAQDAAALQLRVAGLGTFGAPAAPNVLWAGLAGDLDVLSALQAQVERVSARHGFQAEARAYRPHLTLARRARGPVTRAALDAAALTMGVEAEWLVQDIVLYRSHMGRKPAYEPLGVHPLGEAGARA
ncbi:RNA 2',3'-cyclic phosphodiesterase [Paenibacillus sp. GP183]|jgi:2'-5' RNA ligase|uniref:RNA 2',3'-cyclic phosphodiesterase n=1 Tax=Paenibacillus sp. GP183 TaxID=1882751 RepID=UPI0008948F7F|nr:RNA 2',3'-cyclic phosphodiesterase [Paenibacillus sp. GP183]SEB95153.1 2'-5' RNA ligase [Paenibacillus sp. GP183]